MCKHNWQPILPDIDSVKIETQTDYAVDKLLARMSDIVYCDKCQHTGHYIKSHRGGIRRHYSGNWFIERANKIREKYGLELLSIELNPEECDARDDAMKS